MNLYNIFDYTSTKIIKVAEGILNKDLDDAHWYPYISAAWVMLTAVIIVLFMAVLYIHAFGFRKAVNGVLEAISNVLIKAYGQFQEKAWIRLIVVVMIIFPFLVTILFATPFADDFFMIVKRGGPHIVLAIKQTKDFYFNWGGGIPYIFYEFLLNPIVIFDINSLGMGIELNMLFIIFVVISCFYIQSILMYEFLIKGKAVFPVFCIFLFCFLNSRIYNEVFYWFVGSSYLLGLIFMEINQIMILRYMNNPRNKVNFILLCFWGFVACFSYQFAVFSGFLYLISYFRTYNDEKEQRIVKLLPMAFMIAGGVISAFSPGNFTRHDAINTDFKIVFSFTESFKETIKAIGIACLNPLFLAMLILMILVGLRYGKEDKNIKSLVLYMAAGFLSLYGCIFPVVFGQGGAIIVNRIEFVENAVIYIWGVIIGLKIGVVLFTGKPERRELLRSNRWKIAAATIIFTLCLELTGVFRDNAWTYTFANIGNVVREREYNMDIINEIKNSEDQNVVVYEKEKAVRTGIINPSGLSDDPESAVNAGMSAYFQKDSIVLK